MLKARRRLRLVALDVRPRRQLPRLRLRRRDGQHAHALPLRPELVDEEVGEPSARPRHARGGRGLGRRPPEAPPAAPDEGSLSKLCIIVIISSSSSSNSNTVRLIIIPTQAEIQACEARLGHPRGGGLNIYT